MVLYLLWFVSPGVRKLKYEVSQLCVSILITIYPVGLLVKFSGYIEIKAIFEATASDPSQPLAPWKHMVSMKVV